MKAIRDPIHNMIQFDKHSEEVLISLMDSIEFQRLRHIKQLGLSALTYPGAEHTRFAHSLGVTHLMKRFIEQVSFLRTEEEQHFIQEIQDQRILAMAAAMLHDIGHGPFSHALEAVTKVRHEKWTIEIILGNTSVNQVLENYRTGFSKQVADVVNRTHPSKAVVKLLSSQLDTDRIDYLLRDSKMTGAGYGTFDLEWLIHVLKIGTVQGEVEIGLDRDKGVSIAEDFVMARYYMYKNVYFHKTTRSAELLIERIFRRAVELYNRNEIDLPHDLDRILSIGISPDTVTNYLNLTDATIWHYIRIWSQHEDIIIKKLCTRVLNRDFYKEVEILFDQMNLLQKGMELSKQMSTPMEYLILEDRAVSSSYKDPYLLRQSVGEQGVEEQEASEQIFLFDKRGHAEELSSISEMINLIRIKPIIINRVFVPKELKSSFERVGTNV